MGENRSLDDGNAEGEADEGLETTDDDIPSNDKPKL